LFTMSDLFFMDARSSLFPQLNLPEAELRLRKLGESTQIYDAFRKRWVALTPEEWVRQHFLHFLVDAHCYPKNRIAVEFTLSLHGMKKRADIVVFDSAMQPWMLVECKQVDVQLSQAVFDQVARYNLSLHVPFLVVTNGLAVMAAKIEGTEITMLHAFPDVSIG
jgi:hypothetical protein